MNVSSPSSAPVWKAWRGSLLVAGAAALVWWLCFRHPAFWLAVGMGETDRVFLDLYNLLAACDTLKAGGDPMMFSSLDPYHRPFVFSAWWFELAALGLGRKDVLWLGTALAGVTLVAAVALVRPVSGRECRNLWLLLVSPALLLAVNRANQDLVAFLIVSLGLVCFRVPRGPVRILGVVLFAAAAVLKYFPLVTVILLLEFRSRKGVAWGLAVYATVVLLAWPGLAPALKLAGKYAPASDWLYAYGAPTLARDFGFTQTIFWLVPAVLVIGWAMWVAVRQSPASSPSPSTENDNAGREFICGAAMLVGVFFLGVSYLYKLVFAVWLLPWLWRRGAGHPDARWARAIAGLLLGVAWTEGVGAAILNNVTGLWSNAAALQALKLVLVTAQLLTWALVACLLRFVLIYLWRRGRELLAENALPGPVA